MAMQATVRWVEGRMFVGESGSGHAVTIDAPVASGGRAMAPSPMELVLMGTAGCTAVDVVMILEKMRQKVTDCVVEAQAERADTEPKVFTKVTLRYRVTGKGVDRAAVERAVHLSAEKYCSASIMIGKTAEMVHEIEIVEA